MYAARAARNCKEAVIGDALTAIILGDYPEIQQEALISLEPHLNPGHLSALIQFGLNLDSTDVPYTAPLRESMKDLPPALWQRKETVFRYIHILLEGQTINGNNPGPAIQTTARESLRRLLKQGLYESQTRSLQDFPESADIACYNLDSLALLKENPSFILNFVESEKENPQLLACGLLALSRYKLSRQTSQYEQAEALAQFALQGNDLMKEAARQWYSERTELNSLSLLMRSFRNKLPFNQPQVRKLARALPGMQGMIYKKTPLYANPYSTGQVIRILSHGEAVELLRRSYGYDSTRDDGYSYLVKTSDGLTGWVAAEHLRTESKKN